MPSALLDYEKKIEHKDDIYVFLVYNDVGFYLKRLVQVFFSTLRPCFFKKAIFL